VPLVATPRRLPWVALACAVGLAVAPACSDGGDESSDASVPPVVAPASTGDECIDPRGDLGEDVQAAGTLTEPAGIDLVVASADLTDDGLEVRFETAGPVALAPRPEFFVFQGPPGLPQSFEIQAARADDGTWSVSVITYAAGASARDLSVPVTAEGAMVAFTVPTADVPPIGTLYWAFGARAEPEPGRTVLDDCDPLAAAGTTTSTP
jgi:hypothetical protein